MAKRATELTRQDLRVYLAQRNTDTPDGGGKMTATALTGKPNELFPPVSDVDSTLGAFDVRLVYPAVLRQDRAALWGANVILSSMPKMKNVSYLLFKADFYGQERDSIMRRVEAYAAPTVETRMTLMGTQLKGSRLVQAYQRPEAPLPLVGQRYCLQYIINNNKYYEYFRIESLTDELRTFELPDGKEIVRRVISITTQSPLEHDFDGVAYASLGYADAPVKILGTQVADSARYYGIRPIAEPIVAGTTAIQIDTIYEKLVPTSTIETAHVDDFGGGRPVWIPIAPRQQIATEGSVPDNNLYFGISILPASIEMEGWTDTGLPIAFKRKATKNTRQLPLPFKCWQDIATNTIPTLDTYMITNNIYAQVDGQEIQIFSADITSDVNGYCWQGSITIPPDDFVRLNLDERKQGQELNISIRINDETFVFMAEEYSDNRVFGQKSYTVKGRSTTAKLGADYAQIQGGIIEQPIYARQVADAQVATTGYRITEWALVDWYILGGVYSTVNKTPMGVISDIATAAGGFVCSHPSLPELSIRPLYRVKAWDIATTKPDVSVPSSVVISISGQKTVNAQYNGVFVMSTHSKGVGADVWRRGTDREPRAQLLSHALYTNEIICEAAGMNALSKSGVHKQETVTLPIANKYGLHRAELGQIWQIQESTGAWQGIVTGVTVSVKIEHDAPVVTQTINVDRYLGT